MHLHKLNQNKGKNILEESLLNHFERTSLISILILPFITSVRFYEHCRYLSFKTLVEVLNLNKKKKHFHYVNREDYPTN